MATNWNKINIPEKYISWISNSATLGGIILGFISLFEARADQDSQIWVMFCFSVGYLSTVKLVDDVTQKIGPASGARATVMSYMIVLFLFFAGLVAYLFAK
ncbi:hypothetical protein [Peteryoungia algae]|uniref:Uncharacterized protein n=1 Tax=Peteryoungia algae TaxID=2919917 RepID=A0ABT0CW70_9HYPH|nr:hypothetical protein [Rhizobium sp. SSM4.3]MCJ8237415.1 hypothetical protein [Rhizobium sp. SSM4.3]